MTQLSLVERVARGYALRADMCVRKSATHTHIHAPCTLAAPSIEGMSLVVSKSLIIYTKKYLLGKNSDDLYEVTRTPVPDAKMLSK